MAPWNGCGWRWAWPWAPGWRAERDGPRARCASRVDPRHAWMRLRIWGQSPFLWKGIRPRISMPAVERLQLTDQRGRRFGTVAVQHAGVVGVEQRILDAGKAGALAALDHHHVAGVDHVQHRHAVDRAGRVGARDRIDHIVGA